MVSSTAFTRMSGVLEYRSLRLATVSELATLDACQSSLVYICLNKSSTGNNDSPLFGLIMTIIDYTINCDCWHDFQTCNPSPVIIVINLYNQLCSTGIFIVSAAYFNQIQKLV